MNPSLIWSYACNPNLSYPMEMKSREGWRAVGVRHRTVFDLVDQSHPHHVVLADDQERCRQLAVVSEDGPQTPVSTSTTWTCGLNPGSQGELRVGPFDPTL